MVIKIQTTEDKIKTNLKRDRMTIKVQIPVQTRNHAHDVENYSVQFKNKGPSRYGNPYKHSVKLVSSNQDLIDLNMAAIEAYRIKLVNFRTDVNKPEDTKLGLLEKHLIRQKFGSEALDVSRSWNASWRVPLNFVDKIPDKQEK